MVNHLYDYLTQLLVYRGIDPTTETLDAIVTDYYAQQEDYVKSGDFKYGEFSILIANHAIDQWQTDQVFSGLGTMLDSDYYNGAEPPVDADSLFDGGALQAFQAGLNGEGIVVAVIDGGLEPQKDLRLTDPDSAAAQENVQAAQDFIAENGYGTYVNEKIPFAYNYASNSDENYYSSGEDHGMHVAGIIAANGEPTGKAQPDIASLTGLSNDEVAAILAESESGANRYTVGVAPEAQILAMRVIDDAASQQNDTIARAIYDAVALGADVINMSIGSTYINQNDNNPTEQAIAYAVAHGVFVAVAASNSDSRANVGSAGGKDYAPENYTTISNPATAPDAMTVAAEDTFDLMTYLQSFNRAMAQFSSVGPLSDFTLKPDITAPGSNIKSTQYEDKYQIMQGTSMATPYTAGAAALLMQYMHEKYPDVTGGDLVRTVKLLLMNSTMLNEEPTAPGTPLSPRRQGAGSLQVQNAMTHTVTAQGTQDGEPNGTGSLSLYNITDGAQMTVHLENFGTTDVTYTVDPGAVLTNVFDKDADGRLVGSGTSHEEAVAGATIDGPQSVTVKAGESQDVTFTLHFDATVAADQAVEGFLTFTDDADANGVVGTIHVPYLGFYGDLTHEQVFDNSGRGLTNYLQANNQLPLGIGSASDALAILAQNGNTNFANGDDDAAAVQGVVAAVDATKAAISPNGDSENDSAAPVVYTTQNLAAITATILDADGNAVRVLDQETNIEGGGLSAYGENNDPSDLRVSASIMGHKDALTWDGTLYDPATGTFVTAPDGQYYYQLTGVLNYAGENKTQTLTLPITVDTVAPTVTNVAFDAASGALSFDFADDGIGFTANTQVTLTTASGDTGVNLGATAATGHFTTTLTSAQQAALTTGDGTLTLTLHDAVGNAATAQVATGLGQGGTVTPDATATPTFHFYTNAGSPAEMQAASLDGMGLTTDAFGAIVTFTDDSGTAVLKAKVSGPAGTQYFVRDILTGAVFQGTPDANGDYLFTVDDVNDAAAASFSFGGGLYLGYGITPTSQAGVYKQSLTDAAFVVPGEAGDALADMTNATTISPTTDYQALKDILTDPNQASLFLFYSDAGYEESHYKGEWLQTLDYAIANDREGQGHLIDAEHAQALSQGYMGSEFTMPEQDVLTFDNAGLGQEINLAEAANNSAYDADAGTYTITGHVATSGTSAVYGDYQSAGLYILGNSTSEADPANRVTLDADGNFAYTVNVAPNDNQAYGYALVLQQLNADGTTGEVQVYRNALVFSTDTEAPTLDVPNLVVGTADGTLPAATYADHMQVDANANDNSDGFTLTVNGDLLKRQQTGESVGDTGVNAFGAVQTTTTVPLQLGQNVITVTVVDQLGNETTKTYTIERLATPAPISADTPTFASRASVLAAYTAGQKAGQRYGETGAKLPSLAGEPDAYLNGFTAGYTAGQAKRNQVLATQLLAQKQAQTPAETTPATTEQHAAAATAQGTLPQTGAQANTGLAAFGLLLTGLMGGLIHQRRRRED